MVQGMAEHILNRSVVPNLARFCPEADLIVACQHGSQRGPLLPASAIRAVTRDLLIQTIERILPFVCVMINVDVRVDVYPRHLPEEEQIINYDRVRCCSLRAIDFGHSLT